MNALATLTTQGRAVAHASGRRPARPPQGRADPLWKAKRDAGYSFNSTRIMRTVLRRALGQAEREGIVSRNVTKLSAAPRIRARPGRILTVDQARRLLDAAAKKRPARPSRLDANYWHNPARGQKLPPKPVWECVLRTAMARMGCCISLHGAKMA